MATVVIHGALTLTIAESGITRTETLGDGGMIESTYEVEALLSGTAATARTQMAQLSELTWYSRHSGGLHLNFDHLDMDDGLYEIFSLARQVATSKYPSVRLSLRRIGGGPVGGNLVQLVAASSSLQANSYSITSTPRIAYPVGATALNPVGASTRSSADGTIPIVNSAGTYAYTGADYNKGECRIWDTTGSGTEANWLRVWSPDHVFADPSHLVLENGLLRIQGITGGNNASHRYWIWTGAAWTEVTSSTGGDGVYISGGTVTTTYYRIQIEALGPWLARVACYGVKTGSPYFVKTIQLERGKPLAKVSLATTSNFNMRLGITAGRWVFTKGAPLNGSGDMQRPGWDDTEESGTGGLHAPEDNWIACFTTKSSSTGTLGIAAWADSALDTYAVDGGGCYVENDIAATSLTVYLGGVKYDTSSAQLEAEAGTLGGAAALSATVAGASGSGNDQVTLSAVNDRVDISTNLASIGGSSVLVLFRVATNSTVAGDNLSLRIYNVTTATSVTITSRDGTHFAATNTWYWQALTYTSWNGTDTIRADAVQTADAGGSFYIDQIIAVAIAGSATLMQVDDVAAQALTETIAWPVALAAVR